MRYGTFFWDSVLGPRLPTRGGSVQDRVVRQYRPQQIGSDRRGPSGPCDRAATSYTWRRVRKNRPCPFHNPLSYCPYLLSSAVTIFLGLLAKLHFETYNTTFFLYLVHNGHVPTPTLEFGGGTPRTTQYPTGALPCSVCFTF